uniref:H(+)-transporting two-sector ATPase n=1 Tax=Isoetes engelmannii TaxID=37427 RepID=C6G4A6_ISOEN|nr:ATP synthase F0 subunit 8 [Isoetes engelmannii]
MPQLDQFTHFMQFVWLCVLYMTFYVLLYNNGLPRISRILKLRKKQLSHLMGIESVEQTIIVPTGLKVLRAHISYTYSIFGAVSKRFHFMLESLNTNTNQLRMKKSYAYSLGEISVSPVIRKALLATTGPSISIGSTAVPNIIYVLRAQKAGMRAEGVHTENE